MREPDKTLVAYADRLRAVPGDVVSIQTSAWGGPTYRADLVRLICGDGRRDGARFAEEEVASDFAGEYPARRQASHPGSYGRCDDLPGVASFGLACAIWITELGGGERAVAGTWSREDRRGFGVFLGEDGVPRLRLGDGAHTHELVGRMTIPLRHWVLVGASYNRDTGRADLFASPLSNSALDELLRGGAWDARFPTGIAAPPRPFLVGAEAAGEHGVAHFDGKIGALRLTHGPLGVPELAALVSAESPDAASVDAATLAGFWNFAAEMESEHAPDLGPGGHALQLHQLPTRAVTGHRWDGTAFDWRARPSHYDAIHFHSDDLADAGWESDFTWQVPDDLRSGIYAVRLRQGDASDYVPVFVRPPRGEATADIAFLVPTASYLAYANQRLMVRPSTLFPEGGAKNANVRHLAEHYLDYGNSCYEKHSDGSGVHYSSAHRPILNLKPKGEMWAFGADTNINAWLEWTGLPFDIVTDEDLHEEGAALLARYRVVVTGTHPEYHSTAMLDGIENYLRMGGRLMYMGGNGFYWRIAWGPRPGVIEVRRAEDGTRTWAAEPGEAYHSFNGEYGGLWRRVGRPPQKLVGVGFAAQGFDGARPYVRQPASRDPRAAWIFEGVESDVLGDFGNIGGGAAGEEIDRCDFALGSPPHTLVVASCTEHAPGMLRTKEEFLVTMPQRPDDRKVRADMVFFECPRGGAVFSTGSIAYAGSLAHNDYKNEIAQLTTNVLRRFCDPEPFPEPGDPQ